MDMDKFARLMEERNNLLEKVTSMNFELANPKTLLSSRPILETVIIVLYVLVIVVGSISNVMVLLVVALSKHSISVTNIFVTSLSISDLFLCIFSLPIQVHYQITENWILGQTMCQISMWAMAIPMIVSTNITFLIAFDRHRLVVHPFKKRLSLRNCLLCILFNLIFSLLLSSPVLYFTQFIDNDPSKKYKMTNVYCTEKWTIGEIYRKIYTVFIFIFIFCLPLLITGILYFQIYTCLNQRTIKLNNLTKSKSVKRQPAKPLIKEDSLKGVQLKAQSLEIQTNHQVKVYEPLSYLYNECKKETKISFNTNLQLNLIKVYKNNSRQEINYSRPTSVSPPSIASVNIRKRFNKTNRILIITLVIFLVCRLPWNLYGTILELKTNYSEPSTITSDIFKELLNITNNTALNFTFTNFSHTGYNPIKDNWFDMYISVLDLCLKWFMVLSVCINPLLYCWLNDNLRNEMFALTSKIKSSVSVRILSRQTFRKKQKDKLET